MLILALLVAMAPWCPPPDAWTAGHYHTPSERIEARKIHRERYHYALGSLGLDREARAVADAIAWGESRYDACAVHKLGRNEWGRGMAGTMVGLHLRDKWGGGPEEILHLPEVAALVVARTMRRAKRWHRAGSWKRFHRVYAGERDPWVTERWCRRLEVRGVDCEDPMTDVGGRLGLRPHPRQWNWLARTLWAALWR